MTVRRVLASAERAGRHRALRGLTACAGRRGAVGEGATLPCPMPKTLVIAEKPSVGRDLARVLPGPFAKQEGYLEGPEHVLTWAVGHLVQLAEPDEYDAKYKKWRMADLPIVPSKFKLVVRDERSKKQMSVVTQQLGREDVDDVVNACDAGREGELIFAYLFEKARSKKPVQRLWLSSMTKAAMERAFAELRPAAEFASLEAAARSRSESDWIVGMNATRAATIRLRSSFDGAVSLGRVQTPTLAILTRREEEIRAFVPEPYWLVDAVFAASGERVYEGRYHDGAKPRMATAEAADAIVAAVRGQVGEITQLETQEAQGARAAALRPHDAAARGQQPLRLHGAPHARGRAALLRGAQGPDVSAHELALPDERHDRRAEGDRRATSASRAASTRPPRRTSRASTCCRWLASSPTTRSATTTRSSRRTRRTASTSSPTTTAASTTWSPAASSRSSIRRPSSRTRRSRRRSPATSSARAARSCSCPGWRGVYGELAEGADAADDDEGRDQQLPKLVLDEDVETREVAAEEKETKPPRRYSDASLLGAMETAGRLVDDDEMREAMKESGIGTPATRASIIERLIDVGYVERDARSLVATEKGLNVIRLLGEHPLTSPSLTGDWEKRLGMIERGEEPRARFMADIKGFAESTVADLDAKLKDVRIPRANLGPCPVCGHDIVENRKGFSCWAREDPGCGFVIWKAKAGKTLPMAVAKELIATGRTAKPVTGFKGRSGRSFRARLALEQSEEGKWRVEFDEPWAKEGAKVDPRRRGGRPRRARARRQAGGRSRRLAQAACCAVAR